MPVGLCSTKYRAAIRQAVARQQQAPAYLRLPVKTLARGAKQVRRFAAAFFLALLSTLAPAADALSPDQLLERIRSERAAEVGAMAEQEKAFLAKHSEQASLLAAARA